MADTALLPARSENHPAKPLLVLSTYARRASIGTVEGRGAQSRGRGRSAAPSEAARSGI